MTLIIIQSQRVGFFKGLSIEKDNEFSGFREQWKHIFKHLKNRINSWCSSKGAPDLPENIFHPHSPYLNIYVYPTELDFKLFNTWEFKDWIQIDCLSKRETPKKLVIPELLSCGQGKLIYLSMGSFASVGIMKRLIDILSESPNKFIVSKGPFHSQYHLPNNMWGLEDIPLTDVIQSVNLVITCGDTKTIIQCFLNAKPMIVLPLFGDQLDNRIRLKENGFGWGLDPFNCNKETLLCMIHSIIDDKALNRRLNTIAKSMDCSITNKQIADQIDNLIYRLQQQKQKIIDKNIETLKLFSTNKPQTTTMAED